MLNICVVFLGASDRNPGLRKPGAIGSHSIKVLLRQLHHLELSDAGDVHLREPDPDITVKSRRGNSAQWPYAPCTHHTIESSAKLRKSQNDVKTTQREIHSGTRVGSD